MRLRELFQDVATKVVAVMSEGFVPSSLDIKVFMIGQLALLVYKMFM